MNEAPRRPRLAGRPTDRGGFHRRRRAHQPLRLGRVRAEGKRL